MCIGDRTGRASSTITTRTSRTFTDPLTGDTLSRSELLSWRLQGLIRRWEFIGGFTLITMALWIVGSPVVLSWWNYSASYLAILIESIVGIGMFASSRRDSVVLREVRRNTLEVKRLTASTLTLVRQLQVLGELILEQEQRLERD